MTHVNQTQTAKYYKFICCEKISAQTLEHDVVDEEISSFWNTSTQERDNCGRTLDQGLKLAKHRSSQDWGEEEIHKL